MGSQVMPGYQVMSDLLTMREKTVIYSLIPPHCTLIKNTVAQVLEAKEPRESGLGWTRLACGVLCIIKDNSVDSYFLRLYCVKRAELLWEHEIYVPFPYTASRTYFHTFPADGHQAAFNFADETEAEEFNFAVETIKSQLASLSFENIAERNGASSKISDTREKLLERPKKQTSRPTVAPKSAERAAHDFFKETDLDVSLRRLFARTHLTDDDLKNKSVSEIVDYIISHFGGPQAVQRELYTRASGSMTLPRASASSISLAMKKGPLPRTPSFPGHPTTEQTTPMYDRTTNPSLRIRKSVSFNATVPAVGEKDAILSALKEVFRKRQFQQNEENE